MKKGLIWLISIAIIAVAALILWDLIFNEGGIYQTGFEFVSEVGNGFLGGLFGTETDFIPDQYSPTDDGTDSMDVTNPFGG